MAFLLTTRIARRIYEQTGKPPTAWEIFPESVEEVGREVPKKLVERKMGWVEELLKFLEKVRRDYHKLRLCDHTQKAEFQTKNLK